MRVFVIPLLLVGVAALRFTYVRHTRPEAAEDAAGNFHSHWDRLHRLVYRAPTDTMLVLSVSHRLAYAAGVCNEAFSMFNCRGLDGDIQLLRTDFRVDCSTTQHHAFKIIAWTVIALFAVGIPVYLVVLMMRRMREYRVNSDSDRFVARR
eukprot:COSAG04_NODE_14797_length_555_cov_0.567982_1_plen_149_part_01